VENKARRVFRSFRPGSARGDGVGIAIEGVDGGSRVEQRAGIAARTEGRIDEHVARLGRKRRNHFVEQDRDMGGAHFPFPSAWNCAQAAFAAAQASSIFINSAGFQIVKLRPPP
jgi:hypothetical protein